jgi:hypothetical protein
LIVSKDLSHPTTLGLLRALRSQIRVVESTSDVWHTAFDELRDVRFLLRYTAQDPSGPTRVASDSQSMPSAALLEKSAALTIQFESLGHRMPAPSAIRSVQSLLLHKSAAPCQICSKH